MDVPSFPLPLITLATRCFFLLVVFHSSSPSPLVKRFHTKSKSPPPSKSKSASPAPQSPCQFLARSLKSPWRIVKYFVNALLCLLLWAASDLLHLTLPLLHGLSLHSLGLLIISFSSDLASSGICARHFVELLQPHPCLCNRASSIEGSSRRIQYFTLLFPIAHT